MKPLYCLILTFVVLLTLTSCSFQPSVPFKKFSALDVALEPIDTTYRQFGISIAVDGKYAIVGSNSLKVDFYEKSGKGKWEHVQTVSHPDKIDTFGEAVAISGDSALVGCFDNRSVYAYQRQKDGMWKQVQVIQYIDTYENMPDTPYVFGFGFSLAMDESSAIVTGRHPVVRFFSKQSDGTWELETTLNRPDYYESSDANGHSGRFSAISGNYAVMGARGGEIGESLETAWAGIAVVFKRSSNGSWEEAQILRASDRQSQDLFGEYIDIHESVIVVGAFAASRDPEDKIKASGSTYVFELENGEWKETAILTPEEPVQAGHFGRAVAVHGKMILVGEPRNKMINKYNKPASAGAIHVFRKEFSGEWKRSQTLLQVERIEGSELGASLAMDENDVLIAAPFLEDGCVYTASY